MKWVRNGYSVECCCCRRSHCRDVISASEPKFPLIFHFFHKTFLSPLLYSAEEMISLNGGMKNAKWLKRCFSKLFFIAIKRFKNVSNVKWELLRYTSDSDSLSPSRWLTDSDDKCMDSRAADYWQWEKQKQTIRAD